MYGEAELGREIAGRHIEFHEYEISFYVPVYHSGGIGFSVSGGFLRTGLVLDTVDHPHFIKKETEPSNDWYFVNLRPQTDRYFVNLRSQMRLKMGIF